MTANHAANPGRHALIHRGDDLYETPPEAVRALLNHETLPPEVWEPACGPGAIVGVLRGAGIKVTATDLIAYGCPRSRSGVDFLTTSTVPDGLRCIITNPPYKHADAFIRRAIILAPKVVMLMRLPFLEGTGRADIIDGGRLARVLIFRNRLPMMHRNGWAGPRAGSSMAFAWLIWERRHCGPAMIERISWFR